MPRSSRRYALHKARRRARIRPPRHPATETAPPCGAAVQIGGLLQVWYLSGHTITNPHDTYRVRRADLKFSGDISPRIRWRISLDGAKVLNLDKTSTGVGDSLELQRCGVDQRSTHAAGSVVNMTFGPRCRRRHRTADHPARQWKAGSRSAQIETIERTMFIAERTRGCGHRDVRDIGASARGTIGRYSTIRLGVFNEIGRKSEQPDRTIRRQRSARCRFRIPGVGGLRFGGSGAFEGGPSPAQQR